MTHHVDIAAAGSITHEVLDHITGGMVSSATGPLPGVADLDFRVLAGEEADALGREIDRTIESTAYRVSGEDDPEVWQRGWQEVADRVVSGELTPEALRPQYFRDERHFRLDGRYVAGLAPLVEYRASVAVREVLFAHFLADATSVVELGCGTGLNVLLLARAYPHMRITGCDWATASVTIMEVMNRHFPGRISGAHFNMLTATGWDGDAIARDSVVLTVHAMEQLHDKWGACLEFIRSRRPRLCLNIEPLMELYDPAEPADARMLRYHRKRQYLEGYLPEIRRLADAGHAEILSLQRIGFSGLYHEAYSVVAWRPVS